MPTYNYVQPSGLIIPDTSDILSTTEGEWHSTFGDDLSVDPATPQGVIIASDTAVRSEVAANNAELSNQINPNYASGVFLDDLMALTGAQRRAATYTIIDGVVLTGVPGVVIPSGSRRKTAAGDIFQLLSGVTLDSTGTSTGIFQALEAGEIPAPANSLTVPVQGYTAVGWETSNNPEAGVTGTTEQSDVSARRERKETLALQGRSLPEAVFSRVRALAGVRSLTFRENVTDATQVIDGITLVEHSVWACVDGGTDQDVAAALYRAKSGGANWNGAVTVPYADPFSGQVSYVKFDRPTAVPLMARITISTDGTVTGDPESIVKTAVLNYVAGLQANGEAGFVTGVDVSPFEIGAAVNYASPGIFVRNVELSPESASPVWSSATFEIGLDEKPTLDTNSIQVVTV